MKKKILIIAEAGVNHNGDLPLAKQLVEAAAEAGADYVKFQTFRSEKLVSRFAAKADYQKRNMADEAGSQLDMLRKLELSPADHQALIAHCRQHHIRFLSTAFDAESIDYLASLPVDFFKIPSGEATNFLYLKQVAEKGLPVILSTGMCSLAEVSEAVEVLCRFGLPKEAITLLHCHTEYPTRMEHVNLLAMPEMGRALGLPFGYSDHTAGIEVPIAATALGAVVIEKHFTLNRTLPGPDHKASLEPGELKEMVRCIRNIEVAMGSALKEPSAEELKNREVARKSLIAARDIRKGERFSEENLTVKRPGNGISAMRWEQAMGQVAVRDYREDELIEF